jgi:ribosome-associated translation inhibitor RaiA
MIFNYHTGNVTFFDTDREYFEKKFLPLKKLFPTDIENEKNVLVDIKIKKNKQTSGNRFEAKCIIESPTYGVLQGEIKAENIKKCADFLKDVLKIQILRAHEKYTDK